MTDQSSDRLAKVLRLTTALADRMPDAQVMKQPVAEDQVRALAGAARLLREPGVDWPPLLTQGLHEFTQQSSEDRPASMQSPDGEANPKIASFRRSFGTFHGSKPQQ